jgi:hypothetical protein
MGIFWLQQARTDLEFPMYGAVCGCSRGRPESELQVRFETSSGQCLGLREASPRHKQ